jgi:pyridoxine 5'-phosphate synthase PdxJ
MLNQARGESESNPVEAAVICEKAGCNGITVHLRKDQRQIQERDVFALKELIQGKFNLEIALSDEMIAIASKVKPDLSGAYGNIADKTGIDKKIGRILSAFRHIEKVTIKVSAGHGLNYKNIEPLLNVVGLPEVNIGHSILSRAVSVGLSRTVDEMLVILD